MLMLGYFIVLCCPLVLCTNYERVQNLSHRQLSATGVGISSDNSLVAFGTDAPYIYIYTNDNGKFVNNQTIF